MTCFSVASSTDTEAQAQPAADGKGVVYEVSTDFQTSGHAQHTARLGPSVINFEARPVVQGCGKQCRANADCQKGMSCLSSYGRFVCAEKTTLGQSCASKCSLCIGRGRCAIDGTGGKICIPRSYHVARSVAKCGEPCSISGQCEGKLECLAVGRQKMCGRKVNGGKSCSKTPCFHNCRICSNGFSCDKDSICHQSKQKMRAQCGEACSKSLPCEAGTGLKCSKQKGSHICISRVAAGHLCRKSCQICMPGLSCYGGKCHPNFRPPASSKLAKCGQQCINTATCGKGLSCTKIANLGKFCTRLVGFGRNCDANCHLCGPNLRCGQDFRCHRGGSQRRANAKSPNPREDGRSTSAAGSGSRFQGSSLAPRGVSSSEDTRQGKGNLNDGNIIPSKRRRPEGKADSVGGRKRTFIGGERKKTHGDAANVAGEERKFGNRGEGAIGRRSDEKSGAGSAGSAANAGNAGNGANAANVGNAGTSSTKRQTAAGSAGSAGSAGNPGKSGTSSKKRQAGTGSAGNSGSAGNAGTSPSKRHTGTGSAGTSSKKRQTGAGSAGSAGRAGSEETSSIKRQEDENERGVQMQMNKLKNRPQEYCFGFGPGLQPTNKHSANKTLLLLNGVAKIQETFVYVPARDEMLENQSVISFDLSVNDTTIATKATAVFHQLQGNKSQVPCYRIMATIDFDSYVGVVSFKLSANTIFGSKSYFGFYTVAGITIAAPRHDANPGKTPVVSGSKRRGLVVGSQPPSGGIDPNGGRYEVLPLQFQAPGGHSSDIGILKALGNMSITVSEYQNVSQESQGRNGALLTFDKKLCNPIGPATYSAETGWSFANKRCDIAILPRIGVYIKKAKANHPAKGAGSTPVKKVDLVVRISPGNIGASLIHFKIPALEAGGAPFTTTLLISRNETAPILLLNSTRNTPKVQLIELDHYGEEILNYTMMNTKHPQQASNCTNYYLTLAEGRFAHFGGNPNTLDKQTQKLSFSTSRPGDMNKNIAEAVSLHANVSHGPGQLRAHGTPALNATSKAGANGSETSAFVRIGNNTKLTRAINLPVGCSVVTIFASPKLAFLDSNKTLANSSFVIGTTVLLKGYSSRNFSEFKSKAIKKALQESLSNISAIPIIFHLDKLLPSAGALETRYEAYLDPSIIDTSEAKKKGIRKALESRIRQGYLAKEVRLRYNQVKLGTRGIIFRNSASDSLQGITESLGLGAISAIVALIAIPMVALCVGIALGGRNQDDSMSSHSDDSVDHAPPIDGSGLFIASDGHGRGVGGVTRSIDGVASHRQISLIVPSASEKP